MRSNEYTSHQSGCFGTPARSNYGHMGSYSHAQGRSSNHIESRDLLIQHLKRELVELKHNSKNYHELATKLSNVEHRHNLLMEEKRKSEDEYKRREDEQSGILYNLKHEIDQIRGRVNSRTSDVTELRRAFDVLQQALAKKENEAAILENTLKSEVEKFELLLSSKNQVESDIQAVIKDTQMIEENNRLIEEDLNQLNGQIKRQTKAHGDLRERLGEVEQKIKECKNTCYDREEAIKNAESALRNKDLQIDEANTHISTLDNEVNLIAKEEEKLKSEIQGTSEQIKEANDYVAEMQRRKNLLLKEKTTVEENCLELENEINKNRMELNNCQGSRIALENELKHLSSVYQKMKSENSKLLDELYEFTRVDEKVRKMISREDRAREIKESAEKEMKVAAALIKEPY